MTAAIQQQIVSDPGTLGGKPRIAGRRIAVQHIAIWHEMMGRSAEDIAEDYDLSLSEIYLALAYYHENKAEIDQSIKADDEYFEKMKSLSKSRIQALANGK